jgi:AbrB family looped-hinge helix DNA binding protein
VETGWPGREKITAMASYTFSARVKKDGSLVIPREAREQLGLQQGDRVQIQIETPLTVAGPAARNPLYEIVGIVKEGPVDGAENHDAYLYASDPD